MKRMHLALGLLTSLALARAPAYASAAHLGSIGDPAVRAAVARPKNADSDVPRMESASLQLRQATTLKLAMRGVQGEALESARRAAVAAYRAVRGYYPADVQACAEAAFRAGELLRGGNDVQGALAEFSFVREHGGDSPFRLRAVLETGHVFRRAGDHQRALATYESVLSDPAATPRQRDDASLWAGRVYCDLKRPDDARRVWERVASGAEDPLDRVRAYDSLASLSIDSGDLEGASTTIERCRDALADAANEETKLGERVRSAIASMRALEELERAVQQKQKSAPSDAGTKPPPPVKRSQKLDAKESIEFDRTTPDGGDEPE